MSKIAAPVEGTAVELPEYDPQYRVEISEWIDNQAYRVCRKLACRERQLLASLTREQAEKARTRELEKRLAEAIELLREGTETATWSKWANDVRAFLSQGSGER